MTGPLHAEITEHGREVFNGPISIIPPKNVLLQIFSERDDGILLFSIKRIIYDIKNNIVKIDVEYHSR